MSESHWYKKNSKPSILNKMMDDINKIMADVYSPCQPTPEIDLVEMPEPPRTLQEKLAYWFPEPGPDGCLPEKDE